MSETKRIGVHGDFQYLKGKVVVLTKKGVPLAELRVYTKWNTFCFYPNWDVFFNSDFLDEILAIINEENTKLRFQDMESK